MTNYSQLISRTIIEDDYISPDLEFPTQVEIKLEPIPLNLGTFKFSFSEPSHVYRPANLSSVIEGSSANFAMEVYKAYQKHLEQKILAATEVPKELISGEVNKIVEDSDKDIMPGSNPPLSKEEYMKYLDDVLTS